MRILIGALAVALLAGCSSVSDVRQTTPVLSVSSSNPPQQVAECIRDGWQSIKVIGGTIGGTVQQTGKSFSVIATVDQPWHVADITPTSKGSAIQYHFYRSWQSPPSSVVDVVRSCAR